MRVWRASALAAVLAAAACEVGLQLSDRPSAEAPDSDPPSTPPPPPTASPPPTAPPAPTPSPPPAPGPAPVDELTVRVRGHGRGRVVSIPPGIDCASGATCSFQFPRTSEVRLRAAPDVISKLERWSGLCAKEPCTFKMHGDGAVDASIALRRYEVVDLGVAPGDLWSGAVAISSRGEIVAGNSGGPGRPVIFKPALEAIGVERGWPVGISSTKVVAGNYQAATNESGAPIWHPFRWSKGVLTDLPTLPGGSFAFATAMNESGTVVGFSDFGGDAARAVSWNGSTATDLGSLGDGWISCSLACGINRAGVVVGDTCTRFFHLHAARFRAPGTIDDLGTLGGNNSRAIAINDAGDVVGFSELPQGNGRHGFFWHDGGMVDAGALPGHTSSHLVAVNKHGVAVGTSYNDIWPFAGVLYLDGRMIALDDLVDDPRSVHVSSAASIDDANTIVGGATILGLDRAVLLRAK
jgi:probable HAF family extracellular repeat protein